MSKLIIFSWLLIGSSWSGQLVDDNVVTLPGLDTQDGKLAEKNFAGFVEVNAKGNGNLFYWFAEARNKSANTPVLMWINGGPGASSLTGLLTENGPYRINESQQLNVNPYSWNSNYHMLYWDQPVDTGYSYCNNGSWVTSEAEVGVQMVKALEGFFALHPSYLQNNAPFFITGESYAGKYIPAIANAIVNNSTLAANLRAGGVAIGNGLIYPYEQVASVPDYAFNMGFIDDLQWEALQSPLQQCQGLIAAGQWIESEKVCFAITDKIWEDLAGNIFRYDTRVRDGSAFDKITATLTSYLNRADVKQALNVPASDQWKQSDGSSDPNPVSIALLADFTKNTAFINLASLLDDGIRIMMYEGMFDGSCCNELGMSRTLKKLPWTGRVKFNQTPRQLWKGADKHVAGYVKVAGKLTYVVIGDAGHLVPTNQPENALDMISRFVNNEGWD